VTHQTAAHAEQVRILDEQVKTLEEKLWKLKSVLILHQNARVVGQEKGLADELQQAHNLLQHKLNDNEQALRALALSAQLQEKDEVLTWVLDQVRHGLCSSLDMHQQRETVGVCADETITTLSNLVDQFKHF